MKNANVYSSDGFVTRYIVYILSFLLVIGSTLVFWVSYQKSRSVNEEIAVYEASQFAASVARFRTFYSEQFLPRAQENGMVITHDYLSRKDALPLPATMMIDFAKFLTDAKDSSYKVRIYSDLPFPWRKDKDGGAHDDFERWALQELRKSPEQAVWRFEGKDDNQVLRYARADRLGASCIECHNTYPGTPKKDWKVGDVRGVLVVSRPISGFEKATQSAMMESFLMLFGLGIAMLLVLVLALRGLRASAEELKASQIKSRTIVDSVLDAIVVINSKGIMIEANESVYPVLGYTQQELLGQNINILMEGEHHVAHNGYLQRYLHTGEPHIIGKPRQLIARRKDGSSFPIDLSVSEARFGDNVVFTGIIRDISHRIVAQQELATARDAALESARLKSEFLANMSHEIRTPMNGVIGMTELLLGSKLNREQRDQVRTVQHSAESLLRIINDILDFSKIEAGKLSISSSRFELLPVVEGVIDLLAEYAHTKNIEVAFFIDADVPAIIVSDPIRLRQILINLLNNAIKFTERGHVILNIRTSGDVWQHEGDKQRLLFEVMDTGCGIPAAAQAKLFSAFSQVDGSVTRQYGGTGLGLAICKQLAQLMGGDVGLSSTVGEGSCFSITLQVVVVAGQQRLQNPRVTSLLMLGAKPSLNRYYEKQIRQWGIEPTLVETLNSLMMTLEENNRYDVVVLDADMFYYKPEHPLGILAVLHAVRQCSAVPLIIYGSARQIAVLETIRLGRHVQLLTKPIKHSAIQRYLQRSNTLPVEATVEVTRPATASPDTVKTTATVVRILLTEDHMVNQKVALAMLKKLGYTQIDCAMNGEEALAAVQQHTYDVVLMDCQMPQMDGYEATRQIRQLADARYQALPIIALTAHTMKGDDEKCFAAGMNDYLSKPVRVDELQQKLAKWLKVNPLQLLAVVAADA
ncbi:response regulator [Thiothrix fructosivorans]|uniref:Sensor protein FixL n=1 Tax=Thiothrix fructosivorans TaxID=111770 RepID=A0A8B0SD64_9GAMM|nr:response regulator [Thiothrix fructosivorans]MBO0615144.1 response regulator [Thiothrix fructosivorans]QTX09933.1 response regulator [Thiothrix fructosivorans]